MVRTKDEAVKDYVVLLESGRNVVLLLLVLDGDHEVRVHTRGGIGRAAAQHFPEMVDVLFSTADALQANTTQLIQGGFRTKAEFMNVQFR
jgi:hypothetical protein